ncbi:hypothetical protein M8J77_012534 [Diaphorina citri]|nr:hypothetical protein M8J77_012534 [Diaphorina citri]
MQCVVSQCIMQHSFQSWNTNLLVFLNNLSGYFVLAVVLSILVIVYSYWLVPTDKLLFQDQGGAVDNQSPQKDNHSTGSQESIGPKLKLGQSKTIVDQLKSHLTEEELANEKRIESQQLEEIFKLMKNQEDKFHLGSKQDIQDQLKLYGL